MNPIRLLAFAVAFSASLFAQDSAPQPEYQVSGPDELRQHAAPAVEVAEKFIKQFDLGAYRVSAALIGDAPSGRPYFTRIGLEDRANSLAKFGKLQSRSIHSVIAARTYPQMPDATFIIVNYRASYPKKADLPQRVVIRMSSAGKPEVVAFSTQAVGAY